MLQWLLGHGCSSPVWATVVLYLSWSSCVPVQTPLTDVESVVVATHREFESRILRTTLRETSRGAAGRPDPSAPVAYSARMCREGMRA
jgi:hypothetical protein